MEDANKRRDEHRKKFIADLNALSKGEKARLKRNVGKTLAESYQTNGIYWRIRPPALFAKQDDLYFLVATLFPFVKHHDNGLSFGRTLKGIVNSDNRNGLNRRFSALLDADEQQLPHRLQQLVMRLKSDNDITIDWIKLLADLSQWHSPNRYIQLNWAKDYFTS